MGNLRACFNFPIQYFYPPLFELVSGLFPRFHSSDSPLYLRKNRKTSSKNFQTEAEQNLNRLSVWAIPTPLMAATKNQKAGLGAIFPSAGICPKAGSWVSTDRISCSRPWNIKSGRSRKIIIHILLRAWRTVPPCLSSASVIPSRTKWLRSGGRRSSFMVATIHCRGLQCYKM